MLNGTTVKTSKVNVLRKVGDRAVIKGLRIHQHESGECEQLSFYGFASCGPINVGKLVSKDGKLVRERDAEGKPVYVAEAIGEGHGQVTGEVGSFKPILDAAKTNKLYAELASVNGVSGIEDVLA